MQSGPDPAPYAWLFERYGAQSSVNGQEEQHPYSERWHELYREHLAWTSIKSDYIRCNCPGTITHIEKTDYVVCGSCHLYTHQLCLRPGPSNRFGPSLHYICNECRSGLLKGLIETLKDIVVEEDEEQKADPPLSLFSYIAQSLWTTYCNLPNDQAPDAVVRATRLCFAADKFIPVHEASLQWAERVQQEILAVLDSLPKAKRLELFDRPIIKYDDIFFARLRGAVLWSIDSGYYVDVPEEIGLLVEIVGLQSKGHFWKGTWPPIHPALHARLDREAIRE